MEASALSAPAGLGRGAHTSPWLRLRSDEQLVGLFRSGSEDAFGVIHDRYRTRLNAYARQMLGGSGADAEDVMQDVFLRAYRSLRMDERPLSLRAWLYRVAHNRCIDHLRRPVPPAAEIYEMSRTPVPDTIAEAERRADLRRLIEDVRRLPDQQRSALLMREMDGMSYSDLAAALDTSVPAVKSLLVRARIGLVEAIDARDADCADIRHDLAASYDRGVRASGRARRHLRDCDGCTSYRTQLRAVRQGFASLSPVPAAGLFAKLLGLSGAGSGAAAGGAASASGGTAAIGTGAAAAASVTKVAALVCCAAALTGGAVEVQRIAAPARHQASVRTRALPAAGAPAAVRAPRRSSAAPAAKHPSSRAGDDTVVAGAAPGPAVADRNGSGGALAPADTAPDPAAEPVTDEPSASGTDPATVPPAGVTQDPSAGDATAAGSSAPTTGAAAGWGSPSSSATSASAASTTADAAGAGGASGSGSAPGGSSSAAAGSGSGG